MRDLGYGVAPGAMYLFQNTPLTDSLLHNITLYELRILRNEVYARHGRRFTTPWLRDYFKCEAWYKPRREFTIAELSENEKNNVKVIQAVEARRHEQLSTFKDPHLQSYFASQRSRGYASPKADNDYQSLAWRDTMKTERAAGGAAAPGTSPSAS